jgi:hypothetical protein
LLPQADLWRVRADGTSAEQMTYLSNSEIRPHFMREGRVTMTTEKASSGFYQLSGRRINWDLTDYHPLLAQRAVSPYADDTTNPMSTRPSVGYASATDIREGADGNFLLILSDLNADGTPALPGGAGALAIFNRSIGPFEEGRFDPGFLASMRRVDGVTGHAGSNEGYRSPFILPDGTIMVSHASLPALNWSIVTVNPRTGIRTTLINNAVDAVVAYRYPARSTYNNRRQLVFGGGFDTGDTTHAIVHLPDAPMVFTLLTGNLRRGRPVDDFRKARYLAVYAEGMCPSSGCAINPATGVYENRTMLGKVPLADDGSVRIRVPSQTGVVLELQDGGGASVVKMSEEHQLGPGEQITLGVSQKLFDVVCGGCHGSVSGKELDVGVSPDALTGASASMSATSNPTVVGN